MTLLSRQYTEFPLAKRRQYQLKFELILSEAARLFNWQGSRATTLAEVAARLSLTKTCLYYYVDNKQDLIYKCYLSSCEMLLDRANRAHKLSASGRDKIVSMIDGQITQYAATLNGKGPHFAMLAEIYTLDEAQQKDVNLRWSEIFDVVSAMVREGIQDGTLQARNPKVITLAIYSIIQWLPVWLNRSHIESYENINDIILDLIINGISSQPVQLGAVSYSAVNYFRAEKQQQNAEKRTAFYQVGSTYFNQKGYKGTSLDEIAQTLSVTKGAFYYHIKSKEELLYRCFIRTLDIEKQLLSTADNTGNSGLEKIEYALNLLVGVQFSNQGPLIRYRLLPSLDETHRKMVLKEGKRNSARLGAFIEKGLNDGTLRLINAGIAQNVLSGMIEASADLSGWFTFEDKDRLKCDYIDIFINGLNNKNNVNDRKYADE